MQEFNGSGNYLSQFGSGPGAGNGQFNSPQGIAVNYGASTTQYMYVGLNASNTLNYVQKNSMGGSALLQIGTNGSGSGAYATNP